MDNIPKLKEMLAINESLYSDFVFVEPGYRFVINTVLINERVFLLILQPVCKTVKCDEDF